ncbi:class I SAM-dependent methyltransferase [Kitasatospora sp. NPDC097605]|uniref:class I SAM-dependent methyltransferase n=1 Tax=Kitasatospora sp. NPDC097605 TaxID=3157226 RepID=UPI003331D601
MIGDWQWDETLFAGTAAHYRKGRLPYAPGLVAALVEDLRLDGSGRLLDVGCGPGTLALDLAGHFAEVVGVDPDAGMITEAERGAAELGLGDKCRWIRTRAEQLPTDLGAFDVATFGQSFHWMNRPLVAATVRTLLRPGGALVHLSDLKSERRPTEGLPHPPVPHAAIAELVRRHLGPVRRAGQGFLPHGTPGNEAAVLAAAGFADPRRLVVPGGQALTRTTEQTVAEVFSVSSSAPHLFGPRLPDFEADLRRLLHDASPNGLFSQRQPSTEVFIWRR